MYTQAQQKGHFMTLHLRVLVKSGLFLAIIALFTASSPVLAQDGNVNPDLGTSGPSPDVSIPTAPVTKTVPVYEPKPGEKLTFKQVSEILKTTRNLAGKNLSGLNLIGVDLSGCSLKGADMRGTILERADISGSNLDRADLTGANLKMTSFFESSLTSARLEQAVLDGAIWIDKSICAKGSIGECLKNSANQEQPVQVQIPVNPADQTAGEKLQVKP